MPEPQTPLNSELFLSFLNNWLTLYKHGESCSSGQKENKFEMMDYKNVLGWPACQTDTKDFIMNIYQWNLPAKPILPAISREPEKSKPVKTSFLPARGLAYGSQEQTLISDSLRRHTQPCWTVPESQDKIPHDAKIRNNIYCFLLKLGALMGKECAKRAFLYYGFHLPRRLGLSSLSRRENSPLSPGNLDNSYLFFIIFLCKNIKQ